MTLYTEHGVIIVEAAHQATANALSYVLDPDTGGAETFSMGCSPTGAEPATHYLCSVPVTPQTAALLDSPDAGPMHSALEQLAALRGRRLAVTLADTQACRDAMTVTRLPLPEALGDLNWVASDG